MLAVIEALTCFDVSRDQIDVLTISCGDEKYEVDGPKISRGGMWHWRTAISAAMRLQSLAATNQARLLLGPPAVVRVEPPSFTPVLQLDDWRRSVDLLPGAANAAVDQHGEQIAQMFLRDLADPFIPSPVRARQKPAR
jgi:hypothetical protein